MALGVTPTDARRIELLEALIADLHQRGESVEASKVGRVLKRVRKYAGHSRHQRLRFNSQAPIGRLRAPAPQVVYQVDKREPGA
jgi:hypothetical protein